MRRVSLISTGGTIEKTYNALSGVLDNEVSVLDVMLGQLRLTGVKLDRVQLMNKDSLEMTGRDHKLIAFTVEAMLANHDGVIVVHGTDTLEESGEACYQRFLHSEQELNGPVIFTGAMRPYELRSTDALQNLTEALIAVQILPPGVYVVMHNQALAFPGIKKDRDRLCFVKPPPPESV